MAISVPTHITQRLDQMPTFLLLLVLLPFLYIHFFTTLNHQQKAHETMAQENILSVQVSSLLSRVEEFRAANTQFREERHDFRHKMRTIATLASSGEYEKLNATLAEYTSTQQEQPLENYCKFTLLDAVLSSYLQEAKRKSIRVSVKIALPEVLPVNESELATMFANAIENAIHACEKIEPNKRYIEIKTITVPCLMLMVRNSFDGIIAFDEEGIPISQKKGHGFGTRSIVTFCQKNNAFYEFKTEEQDFILKVIFQ
jgi:sensor histidine kinase regulating citrate/malate metabolism